VNRLTSKAMGSIVRSSKGAKVLMGRAMDKIQQSSMMSSPEKRAGISPSPSMTNVTKSPSSSRINISGMFGSTGRSSTELTGSDGSRQISRNPSMESVQSEFSDDPNVSGASTSRRSSILRPSSTPNAPPPARRPYVMSFFFIPAPFMTKLAQATAAAAGNAANSAGRFGFVHPQRLYITIPIDPNQNTDPQPHRYCAASSFVCPCTTTVANQIARSAAVASQDVCLCSGT